MRIQKTLGRRNSLNTSNTQLSQTPFFSSKIFRSTILLLGITFLLTVSSAVHSEQLGLRLADGSLFSGTLQNGVLHGQGELRWENGDVYVGKFKDGLMHGQGKFELAGGEVYEGTFNRGYMSGQGVFTYTSGARYTGQFKLGLPDGAGELITRHDDIYKGEFKLGNMDGEGIFTDKDGSRFEGTFSKDEFIGPGSFKDTYGNSYTGEFKDWEFHGKGEYKTKAIGLYRGNFVLGMLSGEAYHQDNKGQIYQGEFSSWTYQGKGKLTYTSGDVYEGEFNYGLKHGQGTLTYAKPKDGKTQLSGEWEYNQFLPERHEQRKRTEANVEAVLYSQDRLLNEQFKTIKEERTGNIDLYFLGVGGYGKQDVFKKEVVSIRNLFDKQYGSYQRSLLLVNSAKEATRFPLATTTSIQRSIKALEAQMNPDEDILFLYLTSHGSREHDLSLSMTGLSIADMNATSLADILAETRIKWRVIIVSACYSGGFIEPLQNEHTLVITAAAKDKRSYGCSDDNEITDFANAYFLKALPTAPSFEEAFHVAKKIVAIEEKERDYTENSNPQMVVGKAIRLHLKQWRLQTKYAAQRE